jgi:hypothetical protein
MGSNATYHSIAAICENVLNNAILTDGDSESSRKLIDVAEELLQSIPAIKAINDTLFSDAKQESSMVTRTGSAIDPEAVLASVAEAERSRVARIEHECMAKLVNRMRDRNETINTLDACESSMNALAESGSQIGSDIVKKGRLSKEILEYLRSVRATLDTEPSSPDLPPLCEVDASLIDI